MSDAPTPPDPDPLWKRILRALFLGALAGVAAYSVRPVVRRLVNEDRRAARLAQCLRQSYDWPRLADPRYRAQLEREARAAREAGIEEEDL